MAIRWKTQQRRAVERILDDHPVNSGRCQEAAELILPVAKEQDREARILKIVPADPRAFYVIPKIQLEYDWYHHYTTEAVAHYVDALTGADGTDIVEYRREHWDDPDGIVFEVA